MIPSESFADNSRQINLKKVKIKMKTSTQLLMYGLPMFLIGIFLLFFTSYNAVNFPNHWVNFPAGFMSAIVGFPGFILIACFVVWKIDGK